MIFSPIWLKLHSNLIKEENELSLFLAENNFSCDISSEPSLWGHKLSKWKGPCLVRGNFEYENVIDSDHAHSLITAYILQVLCSIGRPTIDLFLLPIRKSISQTILRGMKETFEQAKEEQLIKSVGLLILDSSEKIFELGSINNFFDAIIFPEGHTQENIPVLEGMSIFYESSDLKIMLEEGISQIISVKTMEEIYFVKRYLDEKKVIF